MMQRATQLDPNFAEAWVFLGMYHGSLGETQREVEDLQHAFALRDKTLGSEKQRIEAMYYLNVTGEIYKALDALRSWERLEPNAFPPHKFLGQTYDDIGFYEKAADEFKQLMAVAPNQYSHTLVWHWPSKRKATMNRPKPCSKLRKTRTCRVRGCMLGFTNWHCSVPIQLVFNESRGGWQVTRKILWLFGRRLEPICLLVIWTKHASARDKPSK